MDGGYTLLIKNAQRFQIYEKEKVRNNQVSLDFD